MSTVYGVLCDSCGNIDVVSTTVRMYEDRLPRAGWISINVWEGDGTSNSVVGPEIHACSPKCVSDLGKALESTDEDEDEDEEHHHPHE